MTGMIAGLLAGIAAHAGTLPPPPPPPPINMTPVIIPGTRVAPEELSDIPVPAVRAIATQSLPRLFSTADYPSAALRNGESGMAGIAVSINREGRIRQCAIIASSGSASLDAASCSIITRRARFTPARDEAGRVVEDRTEVRVRWALPPRAPLPFADHRRAMVLTGDAAGALTGCRVEASAGLPPDDRACDVMTERTRAVAAAGAKPGALADRELVLEHGLATGAGDGARAVGRGPGETRLTFFTLVLEIDPDGTVSFCGAGEGGEDNRRVTNACADTVRHRVVPLDSTTIQTTRRAVRYWATYTRPIG